MKNKNKPTQQKIFPAQIEKGIYIDFEGFKDKSPSILGLLYDNQFEQIVLDADLEEAARHRGLLRMNLESAIRRVLEIAGGKRRKIFAFSEHERKVVLRHTNFQRSFSRRYRNVRIIAKSWINRNNPENRPEDWGLKSIMKYVGPQIPSPLEEHSPTYRLREVKAMLLKRKAYASLTKVKKNHWESLLAYNEWDCRALPKLLRKTL
ncbi:MAG TPA: hypothetical protein DCG39_07945 [Opitutae bacterium]|nr:hypothetical protein [Opitutae bacterium]|tara:strand:- start:566 stop:1183 length:618 start_codon:yes stop_codon:yes gene_type:complete